MIPQPCFAFILLRMAAVGTSLWNEILLFSSTANCCSLQGFVIYAQPILHRFCIRGCDTDSFCSRCPRHVTSATAEAFQQLVRSLRRRAPLPRHYKACRSPCRHVRALSPPFNVVRGAMQRSPNPDCCCTALRAPDRCCGAWAAREGHRCPSHSHEITAARLPGPADILGSWLDSFDVVCVEL